MKIVHQIANNWSASDTALLKSNGIHIDEGFQRFTIDEDDRYWRLKPFIESSDAMDAAATEFTKQELDAAPYLAAIPNWQTGYPQPEKAMGYLTTTYDDKNLCRECGIGARQKDSFRIKEPKWGKRNAFILYWVLDEWFVKREVYDAVLRPLGISERPVLDPRGRTIHSTAQLDIPESSSDLDLGEQPFEICARCGRKKYLPFTRGFFPNLEPVPAAAHILKSREYYGSGASASKWIIVSQALRKSLEQNAIGLICIPMKAGGG
jgi:hypothetical protein